MQCEQHFLHHVFGIHACRARAAPHDVPQTDGELDEKLLIRARVTLKRALHQFRPVPFTVRRIHRSSRQPSLAAILCGSAVLSSGAVFADEMTKDSMSKHEQMMKDCMAKQDASKGKQAAMKACKEMLDKESMSKDAMGKDGNMSHD